MKILTLTIILFSIPAAAHCQRQRIGTEIEDYTFTNVLHYKSDRVSIHDFRGKWLVLNFWNQRCLTNTSFLHDFAKTEKAMAARMTFFTVAVSGVDFPGVENIFETLQQKYNYDLAVAFDSVLWKKWDIHAMPYLLVVDPGGIVRASIHDGDVTVDKLTALMTGAISPPDVNETSGFNYDVSRISDTTLVRRSALSKWAGERGIAVRFSSYIQWPEADRRKTGVVFTIVTIPGLYSIAYLGGAYNNAVYLADGKLYFPKIQIETTNDAMLRYDSTFRDPTNFYNYRLDLPSAQSASIESIQANMKRDLAAMFPYSLVIRQKKMKVWRLLALPVAVERTKTQGGREATEINPVRMQFVNTPMDRVCQLVIAYLTKPQYVFIDANETGIKGNVDITLDAVVNDLEDMNKALQKYGLYLREEKIKMNVLVLKDAG